MDELLSSIRLQQAGGGYWYCHGNVLPDALAADCPLPAGLAAANVARRSLWLSGSGACSPLHYDLPSVLLCQLRGRKRVHLWSPAHHDRMRPYGATFPALTAAERIARSARAEVQRDAALAAAGLVVTLRAGDALLMPSGWWHEVESWAEADAAAEAGEQPSQPGVSDEDGLAACCISVGINWPEIADAIPAFAIWQGDVKAYPLLTKGQVLASYCGEARARAAAGSAYDESVFA